MLGEVKTWWSAIIGTLLIGLFIKSIPLAWRGLPPNHAFWTKQAEGVSSKDCSECGRPLSFLGTTHCQLLSGIDLRDEFLAKYGVRCQEHAAELALLLAEEGGLTQQDIKNAFAAALHEVADVQEKHGR